MTVVCAWCGLVLKTGEGSISHGICEQCAYQVETRLLRDISRRRGGAATRKRRSVPAAGAALPGFESAQPG